TLDAAIIFASVGPLVPMALHALAKGGVVVCGGIHMSDIPSFPYADLWEERVITSVANLTRRDGEEFFEIAPRVPVQTKTETFPLDEANTALDRFRTGELSGTAVLLISNRDRKSTRLNSSHVSISYAVFCLKKKKHKKISL